MLPAAALMGGGITDSLKNIAPTSSAKSGDATSGVTSNDNYGYSYANTSNFNVGSGSASGSASAATTPFGSNTTMVYVALGLALVVAAFSLGRSGK